MTFRLDEDGVVAVAEQVTKLLVSIVERLGVHRVEPVHSRGEIRLRSRHQEVVVSSK